MHCVIIFLFSACNEGSCCIIYFCSALRRPPEAVTRLSHVPSAEEFHENWEKAGQPVVLEGLLKGTEVLGNWQQDDYLR